MCLGMVEYDCCGSQGLLKELEQEGRSDRKRKKLSLPKSTKKKALSPSSRFNSVDDSVLEESSKGFVPANTERSTLWATNTYASWATERNRRSNDENDCPLDLFDKPYPPGVLCRCLQLFVLEVRRTDGTKYPAKSLYQLLCGLLRHSRRVQADPVNFLDRDDPRFKRLHGTCDVVFRELQQEGVGTIKKSAQVIQASDEDVLWTSGVLNTNTPLGLQRAVFFYMGKVCCLRGGEEQRNLKLSQLTRHENHFMYSEHGSKNRNGGFYQLGIDNKCVPIYRNEQAGERCVFSLLDKYISKLPEEAKAADLFYCRPLQYFKEDGPWYSRQPRGKHILNSMVKSMYLEANLPGNYTNHSLRATGATHLFEHDVPEKVIQGISGHRSLNGLRQYEKVGEKQKQAACKILTLPSTSGTFSKEVTAVDAPPVGIPKASASSMPFQMPVFNPVINNGHGTVNFTVNICPCGPISIGGSSENVTDYSEVFEGLDVEDLF